MDDDAQIDARICNLLPKKHEMVLRRLGQGGNGNTSFCKANAQDCKWVLDIIAKDDERLGK